MPPPQGAISEALAQDFDAAGGRRLHSLQQRDPNTGNWLAQVASRSYSDGAGHLAVAQRYECRGSGEAALAYGAWEEFRYDALGRRVLTRMWRPGGSAPSGTNGLCTATVGDACSSYTARTWWAGAAILQEARTAEGGSNPTNQGEVATCTRPACGASTRRWRSGWAGWCGCW